MWLLGAFNQEKQKAREEEEELTEGKTIMLVPMRRLNKFRKRERDGSESGSVTLPHDLLVEELLQRLPAKSLVQFKCVSKLWHSTITDPSFCKAHRSRSRSRPGLLMVCPYLHTPVFGFFFYANYGTYFELLHRFTVGPGGVKKEEDEDEDEEEAIDRDNKYDGVTEVVNGIFCMYSDCQATICSVSTGETMDLPTPPSKTDKSFKYYRYYLGFDSDRNDYKLLKVFSHQIVTLHKDAASRIYCTTSISECEILTLGKDAAWRSVQDAPFIEVRGQHQLGSVYIHAHGARYWWNDTRSNLIAFSYKEEVFLPRIPRPPFRGSLHQFGDCLAMRARSVDRRHLNLWVLEKSPTLSTTCAWTPHIIHNIPYDFADRGCNLIGSLPTGEVLMTFNSSSPISMPVYSYNHTRRKFEKLVLKRDKFRSSIESVGRDKEKFRIYYHEEDITPLNHLIGHK